LGKSKLKSHLQVEASASLKKGTEEQLPIRARQPENAALSQAERMGATARQSCAHLGNCTRP